MADDWHDRDEQPTTDGEPGPEAAPTAPSAFAGAASNDDTPLRDSAQHSRVSSAP